jgi:hypothetical protein
MSGARPKSAGAAVARASVGAMRFVRAAAVEYVELHQPGTAEFLNGWAWIAWAGSWIEALERWPAAIATHARRVIVAVGPAKSSANPDPRGCCA